MRKAKFAKLYICHAFELELNFLLKVLFFFGTPIGADTLYIKKSMTISKSKQTNNHIALQEQLE